MITRRHLLAGAAATAVASGVPATGLGSPRIVPFMFSITDYGIVEVSPLALARLYGVPRGWVEDMP